MAAGPRGAGFTRPFDGHPPRVDLCPASEFHGNSRRLACLSCGKRVEAQPRLLEALSPRCTCGGIYKPGFIFFGEGGITGGRGTFAGDRTVSIGRLSDACEHRCRPIFQEPANL
jgi:hypothetical protein